MKHAAWILLLPLVSACASGPDPESEARTVLERAAFLRNQHNAAQGGRDARVLRVIEDDLRRLGRQHAELLRSSLSSSEAERRALAAFGLGYSGLGEALAPLVEATRDGVETVRLHAVVALGVLGRAETPTEPFQRLMKEDSPALRMAVLYALGRGGAAFASSDAMLAVVHGAFEDPAADVRNEAAIAAGRLGRAESVPLLSGGLLKDRDPGVRQNAALALGCTGKAGKAATAVLVETLRDEESRVVEGAWRALNAIHEKDFDRSYPTWRDWYEDEQKQHYVCPEHPEVPHAESGACKECGTKLDRVLKAPARKAAEAVAPGASYVCPAHPEVVTAGPARCGKAACGKDLQLRKPDGAVYACEAHPQVETSSPARCGVPGCGQELKPRKP